MEHDNIKRVDRLKELDLSIRALREKSLRDICNDYLWGRLSTIELVNIIKEVSRITVFTSLK